METTVVKMFTDTIRYKGANIWIAPVCDFFQISLQNQQRKLKTDPILSRLWIKMSTDSLENENLYGKNHTDLDKNENLVRKNVPVFGEIDKNGRILLFRKGFFALDSDYQSIQILFQKIFVIISFCIRE